MDDDTVPEPDALAALLARATAAGPPPALVASRVVWTDGARPPDEHAPVPGASAERPPPARGAGSGPPRSCRCCSTPSAVRERGLPVADYFLWNDDFEFTLRLLRGRTRPAVPGQHRRAQDRVADRSTRARGSSARCATRSGCSPAAAAWRRGERLLYAGSTAAPLGRRLRGLGRPGAAWRARWAGDCGRGSAPVPGPTRPCSPSRDSGRLDLAGDLRDVRVLHLDALRAATRDTVPGGPSGRRDAYARDGHPERVGMRSPPGPYRILVCGCAGPLPTSP